MIPSDVLAECREKARAAAAEGRPVNRIVAAVVVAWVSLAVLAVYLVVRLADL